MSLYFFNIKNPKVYLILAHQNVFLKSEFAFYIAKKLNLDSNYLNKSHIKRKIYMQKDQIICMDLVNSRNNFI